MENIIRYFKKYYETDDQIRDGEYIEEEYSPERLFEIIDEFSQNLNEFSKITLEKCEEDYNKSCLWLEIGSEDPLGRHFVFHLFQINEEEDSFRNHLQEFYKIKRALKRRYPECRVSSNFR